MSMDRDLFKVDKLLDRIENEMKKKRADNIFTNPDKFVNHINKTTELYSLISEEILAYLDIRGFKGSIKTFEKLFRGMQQQINSMLKFALHYYNGKSSEMRETKHARDSSFERDSSKHPHMSVDTTKRNLNEESHHLSQFYERTGYRASLPSLPHHLAGTTHASFSHPSSGIIKSPEFSVQLQGHGLKMSQFDHSNQGSPHLDGSFPANRIHSKHHPRHSLPDYYQLYEGDMKFEVEAERKEYEKIKAEIDNILESRENIQKIQPTTVSANLRQVLRSLEGFKKKNRIEIEESDDEEEDDGEIQSIENMVSGLLKALNSAQQKTLKRVLHFVSVQKENNNVESKEQETMTEPEPVPAKAKKASKKDMEQKQEEIKGLKKKVATIEESQSVLENKWTKLNNEHSKCEQEKKNAVAKIEKFEKEVFNLKEQLQEYRKMKFGRGLQQKDSKDYSELAGGQSSKRGPPLISERNTKNPAKDQAPPPLEKANSKPQPQPQVQENAPIEDVKDEESIFQENVKPEEKEAPPKLLYEPLQSSILAQYETFEQGSRMKNKSKGKQRQPVNFNKSEAEANERNVLMNSSSFSSREQVSSPPDNKMGLTAMNVNPFSSLGDPNRKVNLTQSLNNSPYAASQMNERNINHLKDTKKQLSFRSQNFNQIRMNNAKVDMEAHNEDIRNIQNQFSSKIQEHMKIQNQSEDGQHGLQRKQTKQNSTLDKEDIEKELLESSVLFFQDGKKMSQSLDESGTGLMKGESHGAIFIENHLVSSQSSNEMGVHSQHTSKLVNPEELDQLLAEERKGKGAVVVKNRMNGEESQERQEMQERQEGHVKKLLNGEPIQREPKDDSKIIGKNEGDSRKKEQGKRLERNMSRKNSMEDVAAQQKEDQKLNEIRRVEGSHSQNKSVDKAIQTDEIFNKLGLSDFSLVKKHPQIGQIGHEFFNSPLKTSFMGSFSQEKTDFPPSMQEDSRRFFQKSKSGFPEISQMPELNSSKLNHSQRRIIAHYEGLLKLNPDFLDERHSPKELGYTGKDQMQTRRLKKSIKEISGRHDPVFSETVQRKGYHMKKSSFPLINVDANKTPFTKSVASLSPNCSDAESPEEDSKDVQTKQMYKTLLAKAEQDPKMANFLRKFWMNELGGAEGDFQLSYNLFEQYVQHFQRLHEKCGEHCHHLQRFYAKIGYYNYWNQRAPLMMKKAAIINSKQSHQAKMAGVKHSRLPEKKVLKIAE